MLDKLKKADLIKLIESKDELIKLLEKRVDELEKEIDDIKKSKHNERGAGRKKFNDDYIKKSIEFQNLYNSQKSINEIMEIMEISRATYYRFKKWIDETGGISSANEPIEGQMSIVDIDMKIN